MCHPDTTCHGHPGDNLGGGGGKTHSCWAAAITFFFKATQTLVCSYRKGKSGGRGSKEGRKLQSLQLVIINLSSPPLPPPGPSHHPNIPLPALSTARHPSGSGPNEGFVLKSVLGCALRNRFLHHHGKRHLGMQQPAWVRSTSPEECI